ncbi:AtpZ/AtpI family protein [Candidatus Falkowbacteria bacterium]|nr:AtpZ/AtpI family protein [Candidatus Falkowbacteria bacterium]
MPNKSQQQAPWWHQGLVLFFKLSSWITAPILIAVFIGKWLDRKYGTEPWLFLASVAISFLVSTAGIVIQGMREMKKVEEEEKKDKEEKDKQL